MDIPLVKDTNFTLKFVLDKLSTPNNSGIIVDVSQLENFETKKISDELAFMSIIYRVKFSWKTTSLAVMNESNKWPNSVILKVPKTNDEFKAKDGEPKMDDTFQEYFLDYLAKAHKREIAFYDCYHRLDPSNRFLPKLFYGAEYDSQHHEGLIIMEDLSDRACCVPMLPGLSDAQVRAVITALARMHSTAWTHRTELMGELWKDGTASECWALEPLFVDSMVEAGKDLAKIEPNAIGPLLRRILPKFRMENLAESFYDEDKYGFPACIVHADLWAPNILWTKNAEGQASDQLCAIIDWQTVHSGNPCEDIGRLLALNTTSAYRRANINHLLAFYAKKVAEFMGGNAPFTLAQLKKAFVGAMPYVMMFFCFGTTNYCTMESVVGKEGTAKREENRAELFDRVRSFIEDTENEFYDQIQ
ncbi:hypothetical protein niasHT_002515 [Heterodera trifolii]|uniref:CHK kinase-like domain-containing protein n=1 Tax=Heterodera trifolii TaxID=157864 RepID=A0ABD2LX74_9BILA